MLTCFAADAQQNKISGIIKDGKNQTIANVTVEVFNTNLSTVSKANGSFEFTNVPAGKLTLKFTAVGYATYIRIISNSQNLDIVLAESNFRLDEITICKKEMGIPLLQNPHHLN